MAVRWGRHIWSSALENELILNLSLCLFSASSVQLVTFHLAMGMFTSLGLYNRPGALDHLKLWSPVIKLVCCLRYFSSPGRSPEGFSSPCHLQSLHFVLSSHPCHQLLQGRWWSMAGKHEQERELVELRKGTVIHWHRRSLWPVTCFAALANCWVMAPIILRIVHTVKQPSWTML